MSIDYSYIALPKECRLLERAIAEPEFGENLGFVSLFETGEFGYAPQTEAERQFRAEVKALHSEHPGIQRRVCRLQTYWDILHYLLSNERRAGRFDADDWATRAVRGARSLADHLRGVQGGLIRYNKPLTVMRSAGRLSCVGTSSLQEFYDPPSMDKAQVYKANVDDPFGRQWQAVCEHLTLLRNFYLDAAEHKEAVLVVPG